MKRSYTSVTKRSLSILLRITVSVGLLAVIAWKLNWQAVGQALANMQVGWWLAAAALLTVEQLFSAWRWKYFADALHFQWSLRQLTGFYFIGMYFNQVLPTAVGGDVVRAYYLNAHSGRKLAALASVFLDRLNGLVVLVAIACVATILSPLDLPWWMPWSVAGVAVGLVVGLAAVPFLARWSRVPLHRRGQFQTLLDIMKTPRVLAVTTLLSTCVQVANAFLVWMLAQAIAVDAPLGFFFILVPMVALLTMLPLSINGLGLREAGMVLFLTPVMVVPVNIPEPSEWATAQALTLSLLWFAVYTFVSLLGGVVYMLSRFPKPQEPAEVPGEVLDNGSVDRDSHQGRAGQYSQAL